MAKVSIQTQIRSMETIIHQLGYSASAGMRQAEKDLLLEHARTILRILKFVTEHEAEIREFIKAKKESP